MTKDNQRHIKQQGQVSYREAKDRLQVLEDRKLQLEEELGSFAAAEDTTSEANALETEIQQLETEVEQKRKENDMNKSQTEKSLEALDAALDIIAKQATRKDETFEQAYSRLAYENTGFKALINQRTIAQDQFTQEHSSYDSLAH